MSGHLQRARRVGGAVGRLVLFLLPLPGTVALPIGPQYFQDGLEAISQGVSRDYVVYETALHVGLGGVGVGRDRLAGFFFQSSHRRQPYQRAGFGKDYIGQVGKAGVRLPCRGIGQHHYEGDLLVPEPVGGGHGLRHLKQRKHPLLHPGAASVYQRHKGSLVLGGDLKSLGDLLPDHAAHAASHETEVQHGDVRLNLANSASSGYARFGQPCARLVL